MSFMEDLIEVPEEDITRYTYACMATPTPTPTSMTTSTSQTLNDLRREAHCSIRIEDFESDSDGELYLVSSSDESPEEERQLFGPLIKRLVRFKKSIQQRMRRNRPSEKVMVVEAEIHETALAKTEDMV